MARTWGTQAAATRQRERVQAEHFSIDDAAPSQDAANVADGIMVLAERVADLEMQAQTFASHDFVIQLAERLDQIALLLEEQAKEKAEIEVIDPHMLPSSTNFLKFEKGGVGGGGGGGGGGAGSSLPPPAPLVREPPPLTCLRAGVPRVVFLKIESSPGAVAPGDDAAGGGDGYIDSKTGRNAADEEAVRKKAADEAAAHAQKTAAAEEAARKKGGR